MAYELSFSSDFYMLPGELYDGADYPHGSEPYSVLGAIRALGEDERAAIAREVFDIDPQYLTEETLLECVQDVNTCTNLSSPVEVWLDDKGAHTLDVYEAGDRPEC